MLPPSLRSCWSPAQRSISNASSIPPQFYDDDPINCEAGYYAVQRERQNVALLQMTAAAVDEARTDELGPVLVHANPKARHDAVGNLIAFSTEGCRRAREYQARASWSPWSRYRASASATAG